MIRSRNCLDILAHVKDNPGQTCATIARAVAKAQGRAHPRWSARHAIERSVSRLIRDGHLIRKPPGMTKGAKVYLGAPLRPKPTRRKNFTPEGVPVHLAIYRDGGRYRVAFVRKGWREGVGTSGKPGKFWPVFDPATETTEYFRRPYGNVSDFGKARTPAKIGEPAPLGTRIRWEDLPEDLQARTLKAYKALWGETPAH